MADSTEPQQGVQDTRPLVPPEAPQETPQEAGDEEGETRCICKELDPPDDSGLYIQCEQCGVWQHGFCVGISDGEDSYLEKYWCEQCKPELHRLYTVDTAGTLRSVYQPIQEKRGHARRNSRQRTQQDDSHRSSSSSSLRDTPEENTAEAEYGNGRSRSSKWKQEPVQAAEVSLAAGSSTGDAFPPRAEPSLESALPGEGEEEEEEEEPPKGDAEEDDKKLQDRKRATFSAREEKHYQWMLEKAIRESRRTSRQDEDQPLALEDNDDYDLEHAGGPEQQQQPTRGQGQGQGQTVDPPDEQENGAALVENATAGRPREGLPVSRSVSANSTSEDDSKAKSRKPKRNSQRNKKAAGNGGTRTSPPGKLEIGVNKPMKPRLPSQRTSLNEMRRRVAAILEFISRTQWELSEDQSSRDDLVRFVENQQFVQQVDVIFQSHNQTLGLMDDLTRSLLLWEKKYSHGSNLQG